MGWGIWVEFSDKDCDQETMVSQLTKQSLSKSLEVAKLFNSNGNTNIFSENSSSAFYKIYL